MKDKPYPITGHAAFYPHRYNPFTDFLRERLAPAPLLAPKRVVKRAKKKNNKAK